MDPAAERFEKIYRFHYKAIRGFVRIRAADLDVDGIVSEVFTTAWQNLDKVPEQEAPARKWLYTVAANKILNAVSAKGRRPEVVEQRDGTHDTQIADEPALNVIERTRFEEALDAVDSDRDREIIYLIGLEDLTPTEIADILGLRRTTVAMRIKRMGPKLLGWRHAATAPLDSASDDSPNRSHGRRKR